MTSSRTDGGLLARLVRRLRPPLISVVLPVRNAMPQITGAIEALRAQTWRRFEVLIQDGGSTDGTLEYLRSVADLPRIEIVSEPDSGIGQAYNRGLARCHGHLVWMTAADECLEPDALAKGVEWFRQRPSAVAYFGAMRLVDSDGRGVSEFLPPAFDLVKFIENETCLPTASALLNRNRLGAELHLDESLRTCPDYDFWIRLGSQFASEDFAIATDIVVTARCDRTSMSYRAESFEPFVRDKTFVLDRYIRSLGGAPGSAELGARGRAGILMWAAENVFALEGASPRFLKWCEEAAGIDPHGARLLRLEQTSQAFHIDPASGQFGPPKAPQPEVPPEPAVVLQDLLNLDSIYSEKIWADAAIHKGATTRVQTASARWSYSAVIPLSRASLGDCGQWFWAHLKIRVLSGQVGVSILAGDNAIHYERLLTPNEPVADIHLRLDRPDAQGVMIRNGALEGASTVEIAAAWVEASQILSPPGFPKAEAGQIPPPP